MRCPSRPSTGRSPLVKSAGSRRPSKSRQSRGVPRVAVGPARAASGAAAACRPPTAAILPSLVRLSMSEGVSSKSPSRLPDLEGCRQATTSGRTACRTTQSGQGRDEIAGLCVRAAVSV